MYFKTSVTVGIIAAIVSISILSSASQTVEQRILGTWETEFNTQKLLFIFAPNNKLFVVSTTDFADADAKSSPLAAIEFQYRLETKDRPNQLDFFATSNPQDKALTILEIDENGKLKIQLEGIEPNQERPATFANNATLFQKVSNSTSLPQKVVKIENLADTATRTKEVEAKSNIASINRSQMAYRVEKNKFANTFDDLAIGSLSGKNTAQSPNYTYKVFGRKQRSYITAAAKVKGLKSYVGATFLYRNADKQSVMSSIICETEKATKIPPKFPKFVGGEKPLKCPSGSQAVD